MFCGVVFGVDGVWCGVLVCVFWGGLSFSWCVLCYGVKCSVVVCRVLVCDVVCCLFCECAVV